MDEKPFHGVEGVGPGNYLDLFLAPGEWSSGTNIIESLTVLVFIS